MRRFWVRGLLVVAAGALLAPAAVPLYDGIGFPDDPYRYAGTAGGGGRSAAGAQQVLTVTDGASTTPVDLTTDEMSPQLVLFIPTGEIGPADGPVTVAVSPMAPTGSLTGAAFNGNVYTVVFTPSETLTGSANDQIKLRATSTAADGVMLYRPDPSAAFARLATQRTGTDTFAARFPGPGQFVLVVAAAAAPVATDDGVLVGGTPLASLATAPAAPPTTVVFAAEHRASVLPWVLGGVTLVLVLVIVFVRSRAPTSGDDA